MLYKITYKLAVVISAGVKVRWKSYCPGQGVWRRLPDVVGIEPSSES